MELAIISDSHIPAREPAIPDPFRERIAVADHTIHAGDFETREVLANLEELATDLTAVHGNIDPEDIDLPAVDAVTLGGVTYVVTHGTVDPVRTAVHASRISTSAGEATITGDAGDVLEGDNWERAIADTARVRARAWAGEDVVGVGGHSHEVVDTVHEGVRVLNPGSVTGASPAERATMLTVEAEDGSVEVTRHER